MRASKSIYILGWKELFSLLSMFLIASMCINAQDFTLEVGGKVEKAGKRLDGAVVSLYENGSFVKKVTTNSSGKFNFKLNSNNNYEITVTKPGFITKRFTITTKNVPKKRAEFGFPGFEFTVTIFEALKNVDYSLLDAPIAKINYEPKSEEFNFNEEYTKSMLEALAKLKALEEASRKEQESINRKYEDAIAKADNAFKSEKWDEALVSYKKALDLREFESYPKEKINEIEEKRKQLSSEQESKRAYDLVIKDADAAFTDKDYSNAKIHYNKAISLLPNEKYPMDQIKEIDRILAQLSKQKALEEQYKNLIAKADQQLEEKSYNDALYTYTEASKIKERERYPKEKVEEIKAILKKLETNDNLEKKYAQIVTEADRLFSNKSYNDAKAKYQEALTLKAEQYPKGQIEKINNILEQSKKQGEIDKLYERAIASADRSFNTRSYEEAKTFYEEALAYKASEPYPKKKIQEINDILLKLKSNNELEVAYKKAIEQADANFTAKEYQNAKKLYKDASTIKPNESYPRAKISEIDRLLEKLRSNNLIEENYNKAITEADRLFISEDYIASKRKYELALSYKPNEVYPKDKIEEIELILEKQNNTVASRNITPDTNREYQEGVTEELFQEGNCKVIKRVVVRDGLKTVYMKKVWNWGGVYYFRNHVSITEDIFESETN